MATTVTFSASARFGYGGKQFVARITGRDPKFTFNREFLGRKEGKRGESTTFTVDEPGLYMTRDVDSKGRADDSYWLVWQDGTELRVWLASHEDAMRLAKEIEAGENPTALAVREVIEAQRVALVDGKDKDPGALVAIKSGTAALLGLDAGEHPRRTVRAAREALIDRLNAARRGEPAAAAAVDLADVATSALVAELVRRGVSVRGAA